MKCWLGCVHDFMSKGYLYATVFYIKHYKMSNENFKHHENRGKSMGGLDCTLNGANVIYYYATQRLR